MIDIFLNILNMSITASYLILAIIVLRFFLKNIPKKVFCFLWMLVGIRLILPVSFESVLSLIPSTKTVSNEMLYSAAPTIDSGLNPVNHAVNSVIVRYGATNTASINSMQIYVGIAAIIWLIGIFCLFAYSLITCIYLKRLVASAIPLKENIYECDNITSPFILGIVKPKIYIPFAIENEYESILAHEKAHIKRKDHWIKPLGFLLLTVYWFNPLCWAAYILLCKDIELACDEKAMQKMELSDRVVYSEALLKCAIKRRQVAMCPLAFGELGVNQRVKNILSYKKPTFWLSVVAVLSCIIVAICFLTSPIKVSDELEQAVHEAILSNMDNPSKNYPFSTEAHHTFGVSKKNGEVTVYAMVLDEEYSVNEASELVKETSGHCATAITFTGNDQDGYKLVEYWIPMDSPYYESSIHDKFPIYMWSRAVHTERYIQKNQEKCEAAANTWLNEINGVTSYIQTLYDASNPYIGDHIQDFKLLELLNVQEIGDFTMELETSKRPYILRICFKDMTKDETWIDTKMSEKASYLIALIDNVDEIQWQYPKADTILTFYYTSDHATQFVGNDIKKYGKSIVELQKLYNFFIEKEESSPVNDVAIYYGFSSWAMFGAPKEMLEKLSSLYHSMNLSKTDKVIDLELAYSVNMTVDDKIINWTIDKDTCSITDVLTGETVNYSYSSDYSIYNEISAIYENSKTDTEYEDGIYRENFR